jgi:hypothetical protein
MGQVPGRRLNYRRLIRQYYAGTRVLECLNSCNYTDSISMRFESTQHEGGTWQRKMSEQRSCTRRFRVNFTAASVSRRLKKDDRLES